ncbi:hypothetical protein, unlikely [Trypanosoma brucei gambiense DAL972]|uniref:Uncharacterized protein n=1 Tax=Trypanosoma brucei gambiense (strain MHOM/CI/86/DAL972) TaxID=679716 RepID=C9ZNG6_TRYB9|nr:hypothetical protein, unlikely [Trypanosoma brucei gambiense DAL972]CBH10944.1 hypothetical protein, unlikely [Trypanosoma brucei gambiense DAL972]|eukprot:XP_011773231.1 hypothetical protein, unlikely [Trypanosoma brucei gambiense DAL972]
MKHPLSYLGGERETCVKQSNEQKQLRTRGSVCQSRIVAAASTIKSGWSAVSSNITAKGVATSNRTQLQQRISVLSYVSVPTNVFVYAGETNIFGGPSRMRHFG